MKRTPRLFVFACVIVSLSLLSSCDAMFSNNVFGGMTHKKLTTDSIQGQTPSELKETLDSDYNRDQITEDPELRQAVLDTLETSYDDPGETDTAEGQTAAILAADIMIGTVPDAAQLAAGAVGILLSDIPETPDAQWFSDSLSGVLPQDIKSAFDGASPTPPQGFVDAIAAFLDANTAYALLNEGLDSGEYAASVSGEEATEIAVNAVIAAMVGLITPPGGGSFGSDQDRAQALWTAMLHPESADSIIGIDGAAMGDLTDPATSAVGNILTAADLTNL
jgi:hypothetical protein